MTTLIAWVGVDSQRIGPVYIASDSRITWMDQGDCWDNTQKVFSSRFYPEIFGYSGRAEFAVHTMHQLISHIDDNCLIERLDLFESKIQKVISFLEEKAQSLLPIRRGSGTIIYASRTGTKMASVFHVAEIKFSNDGLTWNELDDYTGGAPQLVSLYKHKPGINFGVIYNCKRYLSGKKISCSQAKATNVEWRNELFEICDGESMKVSG